jgi:hypothetical protein
LKGPSFWQWALASTNASKGGAKRVACSYTQNHRYRPIFSLILDSSTLLKNCRKSTFYETKFVGQVTFHLLVSGEKVNLESKLLNIEDALKVYMSVKGAGKGAGKGDLFFRHTKRSIRYLIDCLGRSIDQCRTGIW